MQAWIERRDWDARIEQGESFNDIRARFVPFIERLVSAYKDKRGGVVLVGHGGTYRCMMPLVLPNIGFDFAMQNSISNTGCVVAELTPEGLRCVEWCGTSVS
jgi:broad specificity phosphatase PhoE